MRRGLFFWGAVVLGGLQASSMNLPLDWGWAAALLQGLSLCGLVVLLNQVAAQPVLSDGALTTRSAFIQGLGMGWAFATVWLAGTFWWLFISMHRYGGLSAPLAALAVLALAAALSVYYGLAAGFYVYWRRLGSVSPWVATGVFAATWTLAELARGCFFTGFPWGAGGYAQADGLAPSLAPWVGVYGVGAVVAWLAAGLAVGGRCSRWTGLFVVLAIGLVSGRDLLTANQGVGSAKSASPIALTLLQGNIPQDQKFESSSGVPQALAWYQEQIQMLSDSSDHQPGLVITPETAIPLWPQDLPPGYWSKLIALAPSQAALIGIPLGDFRQGYSNAVLGVTGGATRVPYHYEKHHLVPFGEFIPFGFRWFTDLLQIPMGDFSRGGLNQPSFAWQGQRLAPMICYEDLFGEEMGARFQNPEQAPTVLVNMSNLAWFGDSTAANQHLQISRLRAMEFARPVVRATNTGATAVIDAQGRVTQALPPLTRGVLHAEVQGSEGLTPYAWWVSRWGLAPLTWLAVLVCLGAYAFKRGR